MSTYQYTCSICGNQYEDQQFRVVCPDCVALTNVQITDNQYLAWLRHNRERIANGLKFIAWDDETIGDKDTYASWGYCSEDIAAFPDQEMHYYGPLTKPHSYDPKRISTRSRGDHPCPFDMKPSSGFLGSLGCFYRCRIFQGKMPGEKEERRLTALKLYDYLITKYEEKINANSSIRR